MISSFLKVLLNFNFNIIVDFMKTWGTGTHSPIDIRKELLSKQNFPAHKQNTNHFCLTIEHGGTRKRNVPVEWCVENSLHAGVC